MKRKSKWVGVIVLMVFLVACADKEANTKKQPQKEEEGKQVTLHATYTQYKEEWETVKEAIRPYEEVKVALKEGYEPFGVYESGRGFLLVHPEKKATDMKKPNGLLYVKEKGGRMVLAGAEWVVYGEMSPGVYVFKGVRDTSRTSVAAYYEDGSLFYPQGEQTGAAAFITEDNVPTVHPQTNAPFVRIVQPMHSLRMYTHIPNPNGLFADVNLTIMKEYDGLAEPIEVFGIDGGKAEDGE